MDNPSMPSAPKPLALADLERRRNLRFRRKPGLRCRNEEDIRAFVEDVGFCLLFNVNGVTAPTVYQAVAGFDKETTPKHDDPTISLTWNTKDRSLDKRWWYYGKLLRQKATLVSLMLLPAFYALSENFGGDDDYLAEYEAGTLSAESRSIYEALRTHGPLHAIDLKRKANLYGDESKGRFDKALSQLQAGLKVLPVGIAEAGAWRYAFIYDIVSRWYPDLPARARDISRSDARATLALRHIQNVVAASPRDLERLFGWSRPEVASTLRRLADAGAIRLGAWLAEEKGEVAVDAAVWT